VEPRIDRPNNLLANIDAIDSMWVLPYRLPLPSILSTHPLIRAVQLDRARLYTGMSFWDAQVSASPQISAYVVAAQNMQAA